MSANILEAVQREIARTNETLDCITMLKAFQGARRLAKRKRDPNWIFAMDLFGLGSTYAHAMCRRLGVDPDSTSADLPPTPASNVPGEAQTQKGGR